MWLVNVVDFIFGIGLFINAMLFIPQAVKVYQHKDSTGLSILTFLGFNFIQLLFALHGLIVRDYLLFFGMGLSFFTAGSVTLGIILYNKKKRVN